MPFWSREKKGAAEETPEESLARLASPSPGRTTFRMRKGGYVVAEVDAFLATVESRTVEEIQHVLFNSAGRSQGYHEDDVDRHLDDIVDRRRHAPGAR